MTGDWSSVRRAVARVAGEAAGLLRDLACTEESTRRVRGETYRADLEAEEYILDALRSEGIWGRVIAEESGVHEGPGEYTVLVDPLDGSRNYVNCIPWSSVSIAVAPRNAGTVYEVAAGAVAPVFHGPPYSFEPGSCYAGSTRLEPLRVPERFLYVYVEQPEAAHRLSEIIRGLGGGFKVRSLGSAALEIAYVAMGRGTAFIDLRPKLRNLDVAAALGLVRECGGGVYGPRGPRPHIGVTGLERLDTILVTAPGVDASEITRML